MIIPFTYNILKRHPALMSMIHRTNEQDNENGASPSSYSLVEQCYHSLVACFFHICFTDPFDPLEVNPIKTEAIQSSLWELYSHRNHYHSAVSTLAKIFEEAFTKPNYAMEDFLDHTYGTVRLVPHVPFSP